MNKEVLREVEVVEYEYYSEYATETDDIDNFSLGPGQRPVQQDEISFGSVDLRKKKVGTKNSPSSVTNIGKWN